MIVKRTKTLAVCPSCGADAGQVDHLLTTRTKTSWYCDKPDCGYSYDLTFHGDGRVDITKGSKRKIVTTDVLMLPPQTKPVYFIVPGMRFEGEGDRDHDERESKQFYYEEHSCPTNWFKPEMVYYDGDSDPHGLLTYVRHVDTETIPPDQNVGPNDHDFALIRLIEEDATPRSDSPSD